MTDTHRRILVHGMANATPQWSARKTVAFIVVTSVLGWLAVIGGGFVAFLIWL
jgi:hypothetical protein